MAGWCRPVTMGQRPPVGVVYPAYFLITPTPLVVPVALRGEQPVGAIGASRDDGLIRAIHGRRGARDPSQAIAGVGDRATVRVANAHDPIARIVGAGDHAKKSNRNTNEGETRTYKRSSTR